MFVKWDYNNTRMFERMNRAVVDSYKIRGSMPSTGEHLRIVEKTYNVKVIIENSRWIGFEFPDEQSYIVAALQWN